MALAAMVTIVLISGVSAQCTPSTCPDGPVVVVFTYANCTGPHAFYPVYTEPGCNAMEGEGVTISDSELIYYTVNNPQCDLALANATYEGSGYRFGVCGILPTKKRDTTNYQSMNFGDPSAVVARILSGNEDVYLQRGALDDSPSLYNGMMVLANANASFSSEPQPYFQYNPSIPYAVIGVEECYSADNCTTTDGNIPQLFESRFTEYSCAGNTSSFMYPGLKTNTCYNNNNFSYIQLHCTDEHSYSFTQHFGDSCDAPPNYFNFERSVCSSNSRTTMHCLAPTPSNPTTEPSSSNNLNIIGGAILAFFCIIASLLTSF